MFQGYEEFTEAQRKILQNYVTSTTSNVFALCNLPEVIKGALFSRYSRSTLGLRSLLLKDFILNEETAFSSIAGQIQKKGESEKEQVIAIKKAQSFYDRILDGYGDDSIGELGGAHLAVECVSMLGAKIIEDARIGGSPLEKSTRYVYFDQKIDDEYQYYREPMLMTSHFRDLYAETCNHLFDTYSKLIPPLTAIMEESNPKEESISPGAYKAAIRAKVLDCLRGLLPASALTNMGVFGNGRFFEMLIQKMHAHGLSEVQDIARKAHRELSKVIPSFVRRSEKEHRHCQGFLHFQKELENALKKSANDHTCNFEQKPKEGVTLIDSDPNCVSKIAAALLFAESHCTLDEARKYTENLSDQQLEEILNAASGARKNRRHKSPRALEHATFTFEIVADFGTYRDLQRHRILTQERQLLTCDYGYFIPDEIKGSEMEKEYIEAIERAEKAYAIIAKEMKCEAQYVVPMAFNINWYFHINLRALQWMCELRSAPAGHTTYRYIAQEMAKQVSKKHPQLERFFQFVDYEGHELGRLGQEERIAKKKEASALA